MLLSPDPPKEATDEGISMDEGDIIIDADSEDEMPTLAQFGYQLLPQDMVLSTNNENSMYESDDDIDEDHFTIHTEENRTEGACGPVQLESSIKEESRTEMSVDFDQVRAAMQNVTLPPSATPAWASSVPEAQWTSYLLTRIRSMQSESR